MRENVTKLLYVRRPMCLRHEVITQIEKSPEFPAQLVKNGLSESYPRRWIGRGATFAWPPRSLDFTPLDFYLLGSTEGKSLYA